MLDELAEIESYPPPLWGGSLCGKALGTLRFSREGDSDTNHPTILKRRKYK